MPWEPAQSSSRASNRWRPPSPAPAAPVVPTPTLKRESWRPTSSWTPVVRPDRPAQTESSAAESSQHPAGRSAIPERGLIDRGPSSPPHRSRESRPPTEYEAGRRDHGGKRDRRSGGGGGGGDGAERSWEAWNNKVGTVAAKRGDVDRRAGPSRGDDYTLYDRLREKQDQAEGRSWSAWKSKVGTGTDDRDHRQPEPGVRGRERGGRERDEGWKARSKGDDDGFRPGPERRGPEGGRSWATHREKRDTKSRLDERDEQEEGIPPARRKVEESKDRVVLPYSPGSRSPSPPRRKRSPSPIRRRLDESPRRSAVRRASPDYGRAPAKGRHSPSPPPRRRVPDRGSPDYALGAEGRERDRERRGSGSFARPRDTGSSAPHRRRSPSPSTRRPVSPRIRRRDDSPSASSSSSVPPRRDRSAGGRPAVEPRSRRERSPDDRRQAPGPGPSEDRYKRPRRDSPDYTPRRPTSPARRGGPSSTSKPSLPPQENLFHGGRSGPPSAPRNHYANQRADPELQRTGWTRDRAARDAVPIEGDKEDPPYSRSRGFRRGSPDYDRPAPTSGRIDSRPGQRGLDDGDPDRKASEERRSWDYPHQPSTPSIEHTSYPHPEPAGSKSTHPNLDQSDDTFVPLPPPQADPSPVTQSPAKGSSPVKIDFGSTNSPKVAVVTGKKAPGLRQFFDAESPAPSDLPSGSHTPVTYPPSTRESEAEMDIDTSPSEAPLQGPEVYLNRIAESEKQYTQHLDTIAPYIRSAFKEWLEQDQTQSLPAFLVHYFGRQPDQRELHQIEQLINLRRQTSKDQAGLRDLHTRATQDMKATPTTGNITTTNSRAVSPARHSPTRNGHDRTGSKAKVNLETDNTSSAHETTTRRSQTDETYERLACVGEGTYGKVYKARRVDDGVFVALKRIRMEVEKDGFPVTAMREIKLLQSLKHDNVIRLHEMMVSKGSVYMVFDYMEHDLTGLLSHPGISFSPANLKSLNHQMLSGLGYLHRIGILHRDMKGSNILLTAQGELKLADFGLARLYNRKRKADYTNRVITLWYRSPELLLGETAYGPEVDMWSAGCIMLEMYYTKPILQGNDEIHQLEVIYGLMGTPREEDWPSVRELPWYELVKPKTELRSKFKESFSKRLSLAAMDLAEGLLAMNPAKRLSAKTALQTAYFTTEEPAMKKPSQLAGIGEHHEMSAKQERHRRKAEGQ